MEEENEMNSYNFNVANFDSIKYMIEEQFIYQIDNVMIVIFYDNELYGKYLKLREQEKFTEKLKKKFSSDSKTYINENLGIFAICGEIADPIHLVVNEIFPQEKGLTEEELKSIGVVPLFKSASLFYITILQIKFFASRGEMVSEFKDLIEAYSDENMNE